MTQNNIAVEEYCRFYNIDVGFLHQLQQHGLLMLQTEDQQTYLAFEQLPNVERYIHLHYDLDINMAGIEAIDHLLNRIQEVQQRLVTLQNRFMSES